MPSATCTRFALTTARCCAPGGPRHQRLSQVGFINASHGPPRVPWCTRHTTLLPVLECLALPGVRRVVVLDPKDRRPLGVISLSDVATFLLRAPGEDGSPTGSW